MVSETEVAHIAILADIGISNEELAEFTGQFNAILEYFDLLDQVEAGERPEAGTTNVFRDDDIVASLPLDDVVKGAAESEDGYIKAPRVVL
ncbi:Asp-tRNA(Asn)/Glu-tRNA(Gln) amidotransferase subunit GatC [Methanofollis formosanus]|uniref:Aspartyl/glutamyl-tRNA(Asn/Gln) amidotransferase subunit C n=1 Tax=Methanofollis formosanus TaxID=299308 RepID=A0A8G1EHI3_9EURY|nr:Asp-tRNA(Asn)/Glu-tRNA(Gln) amidotransferase subunit GatC [Methanofollis formosanus]QYZ80027.1 Asp-tRNA(Asn)/Glu-tRNA(Gln) amidotransferase subunit GatC [Methanofollis formosanus]